MPRIDSKFCEEARKDIDSGLINKVVTHNVNAKVVISYAASHKHPIKVINMGAGVKRIVTADNVCPKCGGKGTI